MGCCCSTVWSLTLTDSGDHRTSISDVAAVNRVTAYPASLSSRPKASDKSTDTIKSTVMLRQTAQRTWSQVWMEIQIQGGDWSTALKASRSLIHRVRS